jgi:hypothetical protein
MVQHDTGRRSEAQDHYRRDDGQADELARAGKSQVQICKALGVSVMTFHAGGSLRCARAGQVSAQSSGRAVDGGSIDDGRNAPRAPASLRASLVRERRHLAQLETMRGYPW